MLAGRGESGTTTVRSRDSGRCTRLLVITKLQRTKTRLPAFLEMIYHNSSRCCCSRCWSRDATVRTCMRCRAGPVTTAVWWRGGMCINRAKLHSFRFPRWVVLKLEGVISRPICCFLGRREGTRVWQGKKFKEKVITRRPKSGADGGVDVHLPQPAASLSCRPALTAPSWEASRAMLGGSVRGKQVYQFIVIPALGTTDSRGTGTPCRWERLSA